jgi:hypothetical protein
MKDEEGMDGMGGRNLLGDTLSSLSINFVPLPLKKYKVNYSPKYKIAPKNDDRQRIKTHHLASC